MATVDHGGKNGHSVNNTKAIVTLSGKVLAHYFISYTKENSR